MKWNLISEFKLLHSPHALLEHRVPSGFADDDICPLHHHNADKEGCVARELHNLTLLIGLCVERQHPLPATERSTL